MQVKIDFRISVLKDPLCSFIAAEVMKILADRAMVNSAWQRAGLLAAFEGPTVLEAAELHRKRLLFPAATLEEDVGADDGDEAAREATVSTLSRLLTTLQEQAAASTLPLAPRAPSAATLPSVNVATELGRAAAYANAAWQLKEASTVAAKIVGGHGGGRRGGRS